ncbi:MAG TPA: hypothetical protein VN451_01300 [Chitinophagaceae bacterium]|nr:hypothetical protein [Chitinophagaceae bacterium]
MKKLIILACILAYTITAKAQNNPPIGSQKGVKEKFIRIKKGLPDIKKNLTEQDEMWTDVRNVKFEMGNGLIIYEEDEEEDGVDQYLKIRFTQSYFSGTLTDYQQYYKTLVAMIKEVFGPGFEVSSAEKEKKWSTTIVEKGKDVFNSPIQVYITLDWIIKSLGPEIGIEVHSNLKQQ